MKRMQAIAAWLSSASVANCKESQNFGEFSLAFFIASIMKAVTLRWGWVPTDRTLKARSDPDFKAPLKTDRTHHPRRLCSSSSCQW